MKVHIMNVNYKNILKYIRLVSALLFLVLLCSFHTDSYAKTLKINYNNSTIKYKGRTPVVKLDGKKIKTTVKSIIINKNIMVPYKSVFKKGCSVSVTTNSSGKLVFKANGVTVKLKVGSKNAYVDGKKTKLTQAPLKVKYISKSKTEILVPVKFLAKALGYSYVNDKNNNEVLLTSPFVLKYNDSLHIYKSYMGSVVYNDMPADMSEMPALSIGSATFIPAEYVFSTVMGLKYSYDASSGAVKISNDYYSVSMKVGSKSLVATDLTKTSDGTQQSKDGQAQTADSTVTLKSAPVIVTRSDTGYSCLMVPSSAVCKALGYYYSWNKTLKTAYIHTKKYFEWSAKDNKFDEKTYTNAVTVVNAEYDKKNTNIALYITCAQNIESNKVSVVRDEAGKYINIDLYSTYNPLKDMSYVFSSKYIDTLSSIQMDLGSRFTINLKDTIVYEYHIKDNVLTILLNEEWNADFGLRITKPETVVFDQFSLDDRYYENKFVISIPGDQTAFFAANPLTKQNSNIQSVDISYDNKTDITNISVKTKILQGVKLVNLGNVIGVIVDKPANVFQSIVVLDAGHGGKDPGAKESGVNESDVNLNVLYECAKKYFNAPDSPVKAYWTRTDDTYITLNDRANYAAKIGADMFVSLHMNSADNTSANGTEVYYCGTNNYKTDSGIDSKKIADNLLTNILSSLKTNNRGVKTANYYVIKYNTVPAVLVELGFISNSKDRAMMTDAEKADAAALAIYNAIAGLAPF